MLETSADLLKIVIDRFVSYGLRLLSAGRFTTWW